MIVQTVGQAQFQDAFKSEGFSYDAVNALYEYYDELSYSLEEPFELDVVAIRCDWSEYDSLREAYRDYQAETTVTADDMREYFEDRTTLIELDNGHVLVGAF